jgi:hypothetical protein
MEKLIECVGDPRAMGHCQGLTHKSEIRDRIRRNGGKLGRSRWPSLRALTSGPRMGRGTGREIVRHYTHLAERMAGIARNADVVLPALMDLFCQSTNGASPGDELVSEAVAFGAESMAGMEEGVILVRTLSGGSFGASPWFLRKSVPEVGFKSIEVTLPWLATSVAGVNDAGIAVTMAPRTESYGGGVNAGAVNARHAPHAVVLVQECLQRFDSLEGCVDWCKKRPRSGNLSLVIGNASGGLIQIEIEGDDCRIVEPKGGMLLDGASPVVVDRLRDHFGEYRQIDVDCIAGLADGVGEMAVYLEPSRKRLSIRSVLKSDEEKDRVEFSL